MMNIIVALLLAPAMAHEQFFTYKDCDPQCISRSVSCIIEEISPTYFPCECFESSIACELHAKPSIVCLRPGMPATGGTDIWNDWVRFHERNGSTTTMRPTNRPTVRPVTPSGWKVGYAILIGITAVIAFVILGWRVWKISGRYRYQRIRNTTPRQSSVYRETTHPLQEGAL